MSENEQKLRAFLDDLVAVCQKHGMAVLDQGEYGFALIAWAGWKDDRKINPVIHDGPMLTLYDITPDGGSAHGESEFAEHGRL